MAKNPTYPTCFDEVKQVSICSLRLWGYLKPDTWRPGSITWSRGEERTGKISITVDMAEQFVEFNYAVNGKPIHYSRQDYGKRNRQFLCVGTIDGSANAVVIQVYNHFIGGLIASEFVLLVL